MASRVRLSEAEARSLIQRPGPRGTARQYVNPETGEVVSRRQAEAAQVAYGLRQKPAPLSHGMTRYHNLLVDRQKGEKELGINRSLGDIRKDPATKQAVKDMREKPDRPNGKWSPGSRKAKALIYFNRRDPNATYDVGDTP